MAESTDKQTRKIAEKRVEKGKEFEGYQEAQNQLLAIQAEQKQNLALQANEAATMSAQNQTLGQAAEIMAVDEPTQNILSGYGLNQPRVIKNSDVQKQGPNNITINNTTINNTSGPVQGREISIRPPENNQGRFKAWLTNVFARQDAEWQKRNQEYIRRESSLTRNANKMMRKIEGLGKEIGNAVDPRKASQRASNSTMNLLKALGLLYFAKKLPSILEFFNDAEGKIRGWISGIGDKIKEGLGGIFDGAGGFFDNFAYKIYNKDGTGILNEFLEYIAQQLYKRKELADRSIQIKGGIFSLGDFFNSLISWLGVFLGGSKTALNILNKGKESEIEKDMNLKDNAGLSTIENRDGRGRAISDDKISLENAGLRGVSASEVNKDYLAWANQEGLSGRQRKKVENKEKFLRQYDKIYYKGESDILTKRLHALSSAEMGRSAASNMAPTTLTRHDLNQFGNGLSFESHRASLAASLDIYNMLKWRVKWWGTGSQNNKVYEDRSRKEINIDRVFYLLKLLSESKDVLVFTKFIDLFSLSNEDKDKTTIKLIVKDMTEYDRQWYWRKSNEEGYSYKYLKIVRYSVQGEPIKLDEPDFTESHKVNEDKWEVCSVTSKTIQKIINKLTGEDNINYTEQARNKAIDRLMAMGAIDGITAANSKKLVKRDDNYEATYSDISRIEQQFASEKENSISTPEYTGTETYEPHATKLGSTNTSDGNGGLAPLNLTKEEVTENMNKIRDFLRKEGFTDPQIAGMMGVMSVESGGTFDPRIVELVRDKTTGKLVRGPGEGIIQWTDRGLKKKFKEWWQRKHPNETWEEIPKTSLDDQLEFMMEDFKSRKVYPMIRELPEKYPNDNEAVLRKTTEWFTMGMVGGNWDGKNEEKFKANWPKIYNKTFRESMSQRFPRAAGILNSYFNEPITPTTTPNSSSRNPINKTTNGATRPAGTVGFAGELDEIGGNSEFSEVFEPTTITPTENPDNYITTPMSSSSPTQTFAESITPVDKSQEDANNSNPFGSPEGFAKLSGQMDYLCMGVEALVNNSADGFNMMASAYAQGNQPKNLTPGVSPLEDNIT